MIARAHTQIAFVLAAAAIALSGRAAAETKILPLDVETTAGGVPVACTGIGQTKLDPKWAAYPVRVEFSNSRNEHLAGATVTVKDRKGAVLFSVACDAPWVLMKLPAGAYAVQGALANSQAKPRSATFSPPKTGQLRVVLQFPDA